MRLAILCLFFFYHLQCVFGQAALNPVFQQLQGERLGLKGIGKICMSSDGDLWGSHEKGIFRYDGYTVKQYNFESGVNNGIVSKKIYGLFMDDEDQLWIWYLDTFCLTRFDIRTEEVRQFTNLPKGIITNIKIDSKKRFWVCTWEQGFYQFDQRTGNYTQYLPHTLVSEKYNKYKNGVRDLTELPDGKFYVVCFANEDSPYTSLYFDPASKKFQDFPLKEYTNHLKDSIALRIEQSLRIAQFGYCDKTGNIWVGTYSGLVLLDQQARKATRITGLAKDDRLNLDNTRFYIKDDNDNLWIGTPNSGVMYVNTKERKAHYIKNDPRVQGTLADNRPRSILKDKDGNILVVSSIDVINVCYPIWQAFNIAPWNEMNLEFRDRSVQRIPVNQVLVSEEGLIYVTSESGIATYDAIEKKAAKHYTPAFKLNAERDRETAPTSVKDIRYIGNKTFRIIGANFPGEFSTSSGGFKHFVNDSLRSAFVFRMLFRHSKDTLAPSVYITGKKGVLYLIEQALGSNNMKCIYQKPVLKDGRDFKESYSYRLKSGKWLISFGEREFCIIDPVSKQERFYNAKDKNNYFPDSTIQMAYLDKNGLIWFATSNGLYSFDETTGKSSYKNEAFGLAKGESVYALTELDNGDWWLAVNKQLVKWQPKQKKLYRFNAELGLRYNNFLGSKAQSDKYGRLYYTTFNGVLFFDPKQIKMPVTVPKLSIRRLRVKDSLLSLIELKAFLAENRAFKWNENFLLFEMSSNQIFAPIPLQFKYRLIGLDTNWTDNGYNQKIRYTNLPPGNYTLEVEALNAYNIKSGQYQVSFTISPPFWKTWWFYFLVTLGIITLLYLFIKFREKAYLKTQQLLEEKIRQRTEEVVNKAKEIERQKEIIQEKNNELTDSIHYAQRIQQSILPSTEEMKEGLPQHHVFFQPKDIVSGDFYWYSRQGDSILWAVVDCTGHGVPGGFMSMLGSGLLNQIVNEEKRLRPDEILNHLRDRVILALKQTGQVGENKDGMDISICRYIPSQGILQFSGANNVLYMVRNGVLSELTGDKQPIGIYIGDQKPFTLKEISVEPGDVVSITSDGYIDQFGGPKGKKFKSVNLEKMIVEIAEKSVEAQGAIIEHTFNNWKGEYEQLDDVCVIVVRFPD